MVPCADPGGHVSELDFSEVRDQPAAVEALVKAIAGGERGVLFISPPSTAPILIARRVTTLLPPLSEHELAWLRAEFEAVSPRYSQDLFVTSRPFRAPHYSVSPRALLGPEPSAARVYPAGELQLARFGVLMLDKIDEYSLATVQRLASKLEQMAGAPFVIPTAGPCPCGWLGFAGRLCECADLSRAAYSARLANAMSVLGITTRADVLPLDLRALRDAPPGESSARLRARIEAMLQQAATNGGE